MASLDKPPGLLPSPYSKSLIAGAIAGTSVDLSLYPLDTLKTRLQSAGGFLASGGFKNLYRGLGSVALGSAPSGALFFLAYESIKSTSYLRDTPTLGAIIASSVGEIAACGVRVPVEVVKQRAQATGANTSAAALRTVIKIARDRGGGLAFVRELYRGWNITIVREIPFTICQFPLWEYLKGEYVRRKMGRELGPDGAVGGGKLKISAFESAVCGSIAAVAAAAFTTPLDVVKTRMMLADKSTGMMTMLRKVVREEGGTALLKGIGPRMAWIGAGGFVFLGAFTGARNVLDDL